MWVAVLSIQFDDMGRWFKRVVSCRTGRPPEYPTTDGISFIRDYSSSSSIYGLTEGMLVWNSTLSSLREVAYTFLPNS